MGAQCCSSDPPQDLKASKIICVKEKNSSYFLQFFNCELEITSESEMNPTLFQIENLSQISIEGTLYLIGINTARNSIYSTTSEHSSNYSQTSFISINTNSSPVTITFEISPLYNHDNPSLCTSNDNEDIFCVGGQNSDECERYSIKDNKWYTLPKLPEVLNGCSSLYFENKIIVYQGNKVFKLNFEPNNDYSRGNWEILCEIKEISYFRKFSHISMIGRNLIIFGGVNSLGQETDDIISVNIDDPEKVEKTEIKLAKNVKFGKIFNISFLDGSIFMFDEEEFQIHKIDFHHKTSQCIDFYSWRGKEY